MKPEDRKGPMNETDPNGKIFLIIRKGKRKRKYEVIKQGRAIKTFKTLEAAREYGQRP